MSKAYSDEKVEIILWLNGKEVEYSFKLTISTKNNLSIKYLKELIVKTILSNKDLNSKFSHYYSDHNIQINHLYNQKEILLEDSDIQYLKQNEIIFFTFDGSSFKSNNHFNQFQFIRWIKSGGYGQVFLSKHVYSQKQFAIKQIDTTNFSNEDLYNISREYMILRSMMHKNVIKCYDSFAYNNKFYTVMDYAEGGELSTLLKEKGVLSEQDSKKIFKQIYDAVCYIHSQNIIHRDLKPNNILFLDTERTHVVIIDFGISGFANGNQREKIKAGTTSFLPPELASGEEYSSNRKLDIWALGVILYRMIEGVYPFEGKNTKEILLKILKGKLEFNKKIKISYPLRTLIEGLLEKNHRFRIDDDSELFNKWFEFSQNTIKKKKTIDDKQSKKKNENHCNYLTPTKSTALKRLPTHSYNSFFQNQNQNLMSKFKESEVANNSINIKVNSNINNNNNNYDIYTQYKFMRKNSLHLPLLNKKTNNNNFTINNEINGFRKPHKKSVEQKNSNISINQINKNNIIRENNTILEQKEKNNEDNSEYININDPKSLYKTKVNSCKQVRIKRNFKND